MRIEPKANTANLPRRSLETFKHTIRKLSQKFQNPVIATYAISLETVSESNVDQFIGQLETEFRIPPLKWFFGHDHLRFHSAFGSHKLPFSSSSLRPEASVHIVGSADDWDELWVYFNKLRGAAQ